VPWYAAHIIERFEPDARDRPEVVFYENVVLVQASDPKSARDLAEQLGRSRYNLDDPTTKLNDRPARRYFAGIRKLIECDLWSDSAPDSSPDQPLATGDEVTYSLMIVKNEKAFQKLLKGESVSVVYED
jgi:hypothetical protein